MCVDEDHRFFKGGTVLPASECKTQFGTLLGLSDAQISEVEFALRESARAQKTISYIRNFIIVEVFSFIKCFDAKRSFDDGANYYMEREWRVGNHVNFSLADVSRVFFPSGYAKKFRADIPSYVGQISFID